MKPYAGYTRVSATMGRDENLHSPEWQREKIDHCAKGLNLTVEHSKPELDVSGSKAVRPILETIIGQIEAGELAGLIVADIDRLSRLKPRDRVELFDRIESAGGKILSASQNLDASTPQGRFTREIFLGIARMQWENYALAWNRAKLHAHENGMKLGPTPFGYQRGENGKLEPHPTDAAVVTKAYRLAASQGVHAARDYLDALDLRHTTGKRAGQARTCGRSITHTRRLLSNLVYLGEQHFGNLPPVTDAHKALTTLATWQAAQSSGRQVSARSKTQPLVGILECGNCHAHMVASSGGANLTTYRCSNSQSYLRPEQRCAPTVTIVAKPLEQYLRSELADLLPDWDLSQDDHADTYHDAHKAAEAARVEIAAYVQHTPASMPGYAEGLATRNTVLEAAEATERAAAKATATKHQVQYSREAILDSDDQQLRAIIIDTGIRIVVSGGRGIPLDRKVRIVLDGSPDAAEASLQAVA